MKLNRREFIKGLFLSAAALVLPKGSAAQAVEERHSDHQLLCSAHTDYADTVACGAIIEGKAGHILWTNGDGDVAWIDASACSWEVRTTCKEPDGTPEYPVWDN